MKKFIYAVLFVSVFFAGLGSVVEKVGARFKSDEKALDLLRAARTAIGGDAAIAGIQSLRIKGTTVNTFKIDGTEKSEPGETEIALQLPDKVSKMVRIGTPGDDNGGQLVRKKVETVVVTRDDQNGNLRIGRGEGQGTGVGAEPGTKVIILNGDELPGDVKTEGSKTVILRKQINDEQSDGPVSGALRFNKAEMEARHKAMRQNELFRLTLGLLLSPPAGVEASYTYGGEASVEGTPCDLIVAEVGGSSIKLFLNKDTNLPVQITYSGEEMPVTVRFRSANAGNGEPDKNVMFVRSGDGAGASAEFTVRYSDYRNVNGVQLPFHWATSGGDMKEDFNVTSYDVNPADISNSFEKQKVAFSVNKQGQ